MNLSIIVLTYNGQRWIGKCLQSLLDAGMEGRRVLVVDNGSTDGTVETVRQQFPMVQLKINQKNLGFAAGNNTGIKLALDDGAEYVMVLNPDTTVAPDCFARLEEAVKEKPSSVLVPLQLRYDGGGIDPAMRKGLLVESGEFVDDLYRAQRRTAYPLKEAYFGAVLFPRRVFETVGQLDECFFMYGEDTDFCRRMGWAGFKIHLVPGAIVYHWHGLVHLEGRNERETNPHIRRSQYLLALKDIQRTLLSRCLYVLKDLSSRGMHALLRLDLVTLFRCVEDAAWLFVNLSRVKKSRDADRNVLAVATKRTSG